MTMDQVRPVFIVAAFFLLAACETQSPPPAPAASGADTVLDAQYAAKGKAKPMSGTEGSRIYDEYLENIGKPLAREPNASP
ncbi:hypothetical protein Plav_0076 [Parvibaculum lavamentivorans DS-1]|uniref:Lipoprotein n=1 Tax=Parvibaculum lavamentivorans (strain DS-1 / DSM 13023 / NCIMB 13966) TaxID=402881 RepID=A7HP66_PARL1|nr:hypothetical protein [Parvibaculum lavamentivorans]ABS61699.1 hypothetical protein Plav_0076 [Parvibaculum lavamentivorans DS-1]